MSRIIPPAEARRRKMRLYDKTGAPIADFNRVILGWLDGSTPIINHQRPRAFESLRRAYDLGLEEVLRTSETIKKNVVTKRWEAHRKLLSNLTHLMLSVDIAGEIGGRLTADLINKGGFRSTLSQSVAKNAGENFINALVYALADALSYQDEVLVDKGLPLCLRQALTLTKVFKGTNSSARNLRIPIEGDMCIFARSNPLDAIVVSAKTRLKEVFHVGTMWKLLFDMIGDKYCMKKWGLEGSATPLNMQYVFATADMIPGEGRGTQGGDVERDEVRNLIAMDASFFDYVFVSKQGIAHVSDSLNQAKGREGLFHELGCILDLIAQRFATIAPFPSFAKGSRAEPTPIAVRSRADQKSFSFD